MTTTFRIATWNLDRSGIRGKRRIPGQLEQLARVDPDILVLTETHDSIQPKGLPYRAISIPSTGYHHPGESCVAIWTRWPQTYSDLVAPTELSTCVDVKSPFGLLTIYGTILTWRNDKGKNGLSRPWEEHEKAIVSQGQHWQHLHESRKTVPLIVAGDFNQARDGVGGYKSPNGVRALNEQLEKSNLTCITKEDFGAEGKLHVDPRKGYYRHNIDHICITQNFFDIKHVGAWDHFTESQFLSDHNGVYVDLEWN